MRLPSGPRAPAPVQTARLYADPLGYLSACRSHYGGLFALRLLPVGPTVCVAEPELAMSVLLSDPLSSHAGEATARVLPFLGAGSVLLADGTTHAERRRRLLPRFAGGGDRTCMAEIAQQESERWPVGRAFALLPALRRIAFRVVVKLVLGEEERAAEELWRGFHRAFQGPGALTLLVPRLQRQPWRRLTPRMARLDRLLLEHLRARLRPDGSVVATLSRHSGLTDAEMLDEVRALLVVGHETVAAAMAWTLLLLVHDPAVLGRVLDESGDRYLDAVVDEALRIRPPVVDVVRQSSRPLELDGYRLPEGTLLMVCPSLVHTEADRYPDPGSFCPERFLRSRPRPWIPFGGGRRRCLGAEFARSEMKAVIPVLLRRFDLRAVEPKLPGARLLGTTVVPRGGGQVVFQRRDMRA